ncbi:MAG: hypothetical protein IPK87_11840 [Planctomycetes bacterium]|nr:hypothetical protein [Planctomycetota bacterium]
MEQARLAFVGMVDDLYQRGATGRTVIALELAQELLAAAFESAATGQDEAEITNVRLDLFEDAGLFSCNIKVKGKAWPPRPPVDTRVELGVRDVTHSEAGESGSVMFRVEKPLHFSSTFADMLIGLLGKIVRKLPVSIDALRHKDALVTIDFAQFVKAFRPELGAHARQVRLYALKVSAGKAKVEIGFLK